MHTNSSWKDYFVFSKKERRVVIPLIVILIGYSLLLFFYEPKNEQPTIQNLSESIAVLSSESPDSTTLQTHFSAKTNLATSSAATDVELFAFNPNTLDKEGWKRLGVGDKTIQTIINYRNKGGRFYKPEDLKKIYGLTTEEAEQLMPFVTVNSGQKQSLSQTQNNDKTKPSFVKPKQQPIDVNTATAEQWKSLPMIGDVLSNRIVKYRDKMGGFTSLEQVKKTYGLSDSAYQIILPYLRLSLAKTNPQISLLQKININTATADQLKTNPSIPSEVAEAIVVFRQQHGKYSSVNDIKKIVFIKDELFQKIAPFLTIQ